MPVLNITVSLSEVLEVRDGPLTDTEIWALLCQSAEALQDVFLAGESHRENVLAFVINPDTLFLTSDGRLEFGHALKVQQYANYMAAEMEEEFMLTDSSVEQVYVFALGKSLIYSSEYGLKPDEHNESINTSARMSKPVRICENLESLLRSMTHRNSSQRAPLLKVMEACTAQKERRGRGLDRSFSRTVTNLYKTVLGLEGQSEETMTEQIYTSNTSRQNISPRELTVDRSRRKQKKSRDSRRKKHSSPEHYRSRSRSHSRSRSRSQSKHKGHGRGADSPDSGLHRITPLPSGSYSRSGDENNGRESRPDLVSADYAAGRSYHLSDITFSASQNGQSSDRPPPPSSSSHHHTRPSNRNITSPRAVDNPAFKKYLKLKERQRKLRVLRHDAMSDDASDELSDIVLDHMSETRSVRSLGSHNNGVYHPDIHMRYGSNSALRLSRESDRESVISSDNSTYGQEHQAFRATADISDPYIQQLQQMTTSRPPQLPKFDKQATPTKHKKKPLSPRQKPRDFYGPEFIHRSTKPIQRIPLALQGESRKNPGRVCRVVIVLLNGQKLEAMVDPSTMGQQLFEAVVTEIELPEFYFFGLTYVNDNEHFFISGDTKLHKVAPDSWKDSWKREAAPVTFTVYLRVKFYVDNLAALKHETTRHQLYLQLRRDILEERCLCDEDKALGMAGLALQAEYGDYNKDTMARNYFIPEHYFSERTLKRLGTGYLRDHGPDAHKNLKGLSEMEAQMEFIKIIQEHLPEYGIHFHKLLKEKKGKTNGVIWVGVNMDELVLAEDVNGERVFAHQYAWSDIQKISFNRRRFSVQPRPDISQMKPFKMNFYTSSYRKGQYLLKFCTAQHSFQLKIRTRLAAHDGVSDLSQAEHMSIGGTEDMGSEHSEDEHTLTDEAESRNIQDVEMESAGFGATDHVPQKHPAAYRNPPPYRPDTSASMIDIPMGARVSGAPVQHVPRSATTSEIDHVGQVQGQNDALLEATPVSEEDIAAETVQPAEAYVIDTSTRSTDMTLFSPPGNETISNTLHQRFTNELLSPDHDVLEREVFEVILSKQPTVGIGITIVGGDTSSKHDFGIFVKSVTVDGPAFEDGRIKPGDRLIAINDQSLECLQHHEAVNMIKQSGDTVRLLISQVRQPRSLRRREIDINYELDTDSQSKLERSFAIRRRSSESDEENSSFRNSACESTSPVITVRNCTSVHNQDILDKNYKNSQNVIKKHEKNVDIVSEQLFSGPEKLDESVDQERPTSATIDVHSTLSQVDSLYTEMAVSDLPADRQDDGTEMFDESDTDSEFEDVVNHVIENSYKHTHSPTSERSDSSPVEGVEVFEVFLEKQQGSFGLNVTGGVNTSVRHGGIYVKSVVKDSTADCDGTIRKGDRILEVDSASLDGFTHRQAIEALCTAPPFCKFLVERSPRSPTSSISSHMSQISIDRSSGSPDEKQETNEEMGDIYDIFTTEENTYAVELIKGSYGLGFSTVGGHQDRNTKLEERVVRIKRVFTIGPAADSGVIHSGDVILAVNRQSVAGLTHTETMSQLRSAGKHVQLLMCQPDSEQLPPLVQLESEESLEITPTGSTANVTDTESDTDSDIEVTPRHEASITLSSGFAVSSPYPDVEEGNILVRAGSPPPPLPISPPPILLNTGYEDDNSMGDEVEVQVGVAELMDSCTHEMVLIHNAKKNHMAQQMLNGSLIVREDSALTVDSRDVTPVVPESSREVTPSINNAGDVTPVEDEDALEREANLSDIEHLDFSAHQSRRISQDSLQSDSEVSVPGSPVENLEGICSLESTFQSHNSQAEVLSETDTGDLSKSDLSTSVGVDDRLGTYSVSQADGQSAQASLEMGTSHVNTYSVDQNYDGVIDRLRDDLGGTYVNTDDLDNDVNSKESLNHRVNSVNGENRGDESDDVDDDVKQLEKQYQELDSEEEEDDSVRDDDDDDDDGGDDDDDLIGSEGHQEVNACLKEDESEHNVGNKDDVSNDDDVQVDYVDDDDNGVEREEIIFQEHKDVDEVVEDDEGSEIEESVSDHSSVRGSPSPLLQQQPLRIGEFVVTLTKPEGRGLGFTVAGGAKTTGGCYVKAVLQNPALSDGNVKSGDKLIMVNDVDMRPLNHFEAVSVLREAGKEVTICLSRENLAVGDTRQAGIVNLSYSQGLADGGNNYLPQDNVECDEEDKSDAITDGDGCGPLQDLIASLEESLEDSRISSNLEADSKMYGENYWKDKSQKEARGPSTHKTTHFGEPSVYQIDIHKPDSGGLGISLVTAETQNQTGVFIRTITPGGVADSDGRLQLGDKILQINGESLIGMNHNKAATILRNSQGRLSLTVSRNKGRKPSWLDSDKTENQPDTGLSGDERSNSGEKGKSETKLENTDGMPLSLSDQEVHSCPNNDDDDDDDIDDNTDESENNDLTNASLSITKHVPSDIDDDDVDDLVAQAEQILQNAELDSGTESEGSETDGADKETATGAHIYLSATEVINYHPDEIYIESEEDGIENINESIFEPKSEEFKEHDSEHYDSATNGDETIDDSDKCWCNSLRNLDLTIPDEVGADWLFNLSLVTIPEHMKQSVPSIISDMQEKIEIEDPQVEFKLLRDVPLTDECTTATLPNNRPKNRFRNVLPYDANRVRLSESEETDYINASRVKLDVADTVCDYIACQGPLPDTTDAFWQMIWQEQVTVIAMLTLDMEVMKVKCHRYWPDSVDTPIEVCNSKLRLSLLYLNSLEDFDIRNILIEDVETGETRTLYHLNYTTWPDHGTPNSAVPLLQCMRLSHMYRSSGPIVVHCSAGIGRSGTFITIDVALAHVERGLEFDVFEIGQELRRQRQGMIQTRDQYLFCYTACVESLLETPS